jgi:hypothetical protein
MGALVSFSSRLEEPSKTESSISISILEPSKPFKSYTYLPSPPPSSPTTPIPTTTTTTMSAPAPAPAPLRLPMPPPHLVQQQQQNLHHQLMLMARVLFSMREEIATQRNMISETQASLQQIFARLNEQKRMQHAALGLVALSSSCECCNKRPRSDNEDDAGPATKRVKVV